MKKITKKLLFVLTMVIMCFAVAVSANAETEGYYTYTVSNGEATITDVDSNISGDITIPSTLGGYNVTAIEHSAFSYCKKITSVIIGDNITSISNSMFSDCSGITSVTISEGVTSIGNGAFSSCESLTEITIPNSVTNIANNAFGYCTNLSNIAVESNNINYSNDEYGVLFDKNKTTLIQYPIGNTRDLYTIPDGVTHIGTGAFSHSTNLTNIFIPDVVVSVGDWAFSGCSNLISIMMPDTVISLGDRVFNDCFNLKNAAIGVGVKNITEGMFYNCYGLTSITIPNGVTNIGEESFAYCYNLIDVTIPDSVTNLSDYAFRDCTSLESILLPCSVASIGDYVFNSCVNLKNIIVDSNNKYYSNDEYGVLLNYDKSVLIKYPSGNSRTLYTIPESVEFIGKGAFSESINLININIPDGVTVIDNSAFTWCENIISLVIPNSVTSIGYSVFWGCKNLKNIDIPYNIPCINSDTFCYCENLISVTIPCGVTSIGENAFGWCTSLTDVYYKGTEEQWNEIIIEDYNEKLLNATIHFLGDEEHSHTPSEQIIPASCTVPGMKFYVCSECGEPIGEPEIIPAAHTPGEWETTLEPTYEAAGERVKKCTVCGEVLEREVLPKLELTVVEDENTGVSIGFPGDKYDGKVDITVEESFDGTAINILDTKTGAVQSKIFDIKMTVDGVECQPNGKITVKIPLPAGYNPKFSFVYYVNAETGALEKMDAVYEDGYMIFETDHFSYYAVIQEPDTDNCSCNCHAGGIKGFFFKILLFFQKIFRANRECKCGIMHY